MINYKLEVIIQNLNKNEYEKLKTIIAKTKEQTKNPIYGNISHTLIDSRILLYKNKDMFSNLGLHEEDITFIILVTSFLKQLITNLVLYNFDFQIKDILFEQTINGAYSSDKFIFFKNILNEAYNDKTLNINKDKLLTNFDERGNGKYLLNVISLEKINRFNSDNGFIPGLSDFTELLLNYIHKYYDNIHYTDWKITNDKNKKDIAIGILSTQEEFDKDYTYDTSTTCMRDIGENNVQLI